jgi:hypothetical protein
MTLRCSIGNQPNGLLNYELKTDDNLLFLDTNMDVGGGASEDLL